MEDPWQVPDEEEPAPAAVRTAVAAGGEHLDRAARGAPQVIDQAGEREVQVARAEQHGPQDGLGPQDGRRYSRHRTENPQTCSSPE
jgi:hypothetical protein